MGFKLGKSRGNYAVGGEIKTKMRFGKQAGEAGSVPGTPVIRVPLDEGVMGEANMDGTITVDPGLDLNSPFGRQVLRHEQQHIKDFESGRSAYNDSAVLWDGSTYLRREINGEKVIDGPNGRWPEGDPNHPWEQVAIEAEKKRV